MKKKGAEIIALNFSQEPLTDAKETEKARKLADIIGCSKFTSIKIGKQLAEIVKKCEHKFYYIIQRRLMLRIAEKIAEKEGCNYLVTGDNLGQVGSQTLPNMSVIDKATSMTVLRPVLCNDKVETIDLSKKIGTHDTSIGPELCSLLGPKSPATMSQLYRIEEEEAHLDIQIMIKDALS